MKNLAKIWILPVLVFTLALIPRLYRLPEVFLFGADEEYQATYARTISEDFHLVWIGVSAGNTGFYLGPYWTYLTALVLKLAGGDPLLTGYAAAVLGAATASLIYLLGRQLVGRRAGLLASMFYALSPLTIYFDQKYWNPSSLPILSLVLVSSAALLSGRPLFLYLFAVALAMILHVHLSLVPLAALLLLFALPALFRFSRRQLVLALLLCLLTLAPLIVFDYYHDASNLTTPLRWGQIRSGLAPAPGEHLGIALAMLARLWYLTPGLASGSEARPLCLPGASTIPSAWLITLAALPIVIFALQRSTWTDPRRRLLILGYLSITLPFIFYPGKNYEYYLLGTIPLYFLMVGSLLTPLKRFLLLPMVLLFAMFTARTLSQNDAVWGLAAKRELIQESLARVGEAPFTLVESGNQCHRYGGWRYLYTVYGRYPERASTDSGLGWLYPAEITNTPAAYQLELISTPTGYQYRIHSSQ